MTGACCVPEAPTDAATGPVGPISATPVDMHMRDLAGGRATIGDDGDHTIAGDGEGPERTVTLSPYLIGLAPVTNQEFAAFVAATGHVTEAERTGWSFVFDALVDPSAAHVEGRVAGTPWWLRVGGATWRSPAGPGSDVDDLADHPVVHTSWHDARAYARWARTRLPTEAEWEHAARGGLVGARNPWGDEHPLDGDGPPRANVFVGDFPHPHAPVGTTAVGTYAPNGLGLVDVAGNVWEWVEDAWTIDHDLGPVTDPVTSGDRRARRVLRGGSHLCHDSYCTRYRVSARSSSTPRSTAGNVGFRVAASQDGP